MREHLRRSLPEYMVPGYLMKLDRLPLTANGKIDRKALPPPEGGGEKVYAPPRTAVEKLLADIWAATLKREKIGIHDNFFSLGGDSILGVKIIAEANRNNLQLSLRRLFEDQTIAELARTADNSGRELREAPPKATVLRWDPNTVLRRVNFSWKQLIELTADHAKNGNPSSIENVYPLSALQQGMLFHVLNTPAARLYVNQQIYDLEGSLDTVALKNAFQLLIDKHETLRSALVFTPQGEPLQVVFRMAEVPWEQHEYSGLSSEQENHVIEELLKVDREKHFDLAHAPLLRVALLCLPGRRYHLILSFHLILVDGWSIPLIFQELIAGYKTLRLGQPARPSPLVDYGNYVDWLDRQDVGRAEAFWRKALAGFTHPTALGSDRAQPESNECTESYAEKVVILDENITAALTSFLAHAQITLNTVVQGAWALTLARRSGTEDVVFGSVSSGRPVDLPGADSIIGFFLNTIPVRVRIPGGCSILAWLAGLQLEQAEARLYEWSTLIDIQRWSEIPRGQPLFESVLIVQNIPVELDLPEGADGLKVLAIRSTERNSFPLTLTITPGQRLLLKMVYNSGRFSDEAVSRILDQFQTMLVKMTASRDESVSSLTRRKDRDGLLQLSAFNQVLEAQ